jgi:hypothetical protein
MSCPKIDRPGQLIAFRRASRTHFVTKQENIEQNIEL